MKKPYVIIHTLTSLDGRIRKIELPEFDSAALQYEQLALHALRWTLLATWAGRNFVDYGSLRSHVVSVLTEKTSNAYTDLLRRLNISYVIAGKDEPDNAIATTGQKPIADVLALLCVRPLRPNNRLSRPSA